MKLTILPLTPDLWPALEDLFGKSGACNGCWCMYWRIGSAYHKRPRERNRADFREVVRGGPPPGLVAFNGDIAVGWCQLTPTVGCLGLTAPGGSRASMICRSGRSIASMCVRGIAGKALRRN